MSSLAKNMKTLAAVVGFAAAGVATGAQAQSTTDCGLTAMSAQASPAIYDPFNPSGLASTTINMTITRINPEGGGTTSVLNFYLKPNSATGSTANGIEIIPLSISGQANLEGQGLDIFYGTNETPPASMLPITISPTSTNRFAKIYFTGNNAGSDNVNVTFQVNIPANLNLNASQTLSFDAWFGCNIQGGKLNGQQLQGSRANAVVFPVTVLSALRASYAGTALDFGEIGAIPATPPAPVRTDPANHVLVLSSGAYQVQLTSQNGYKMKRSGAATVNDEVRYSLKFLGDTRSPSDTSEINHTCIRAGLTSTGQQLPIQATLIDGGAGKNPATDYNDQLTVTLTPLAYNTTASDNCGGYTL